MNPTVFASGDVLAEFRPQLEAMLTQAGRAPAVLEFTPGHTLTSAQSDSIEVAYYSRDIWDGTIKTGLSPYAREFWAAADAAVNLKWVHVFSSGADQVPYQPSLRRGVRLTTSTGANADTVALTAFTGLMMLARGFYHYVRAQQRREWAPLLGADMLPDLPGQTAVIVGMGHIGKAVARCLHAMGVHVVGVRRTVAPAETFDEVFPLGALDALLPRCDWLILACPLGPETRGLIDERRLRMLPASAGFVNVARGEIVDEVALTRTLASGHLRGAYLDAFTVEPLDRESPLWALPNVIITPHNAASTQSNSRRATELFVKNLQAYLRGEQPLVNEVGCN